MAPWRRPYPVPGDVILRFVFAGLLLLTAGLAALQSAPASGLAWLGSWSLVLFAYAARMLFVGVFLNDEGIMVRHFWRSTVIPWRQVSGVRVEQGTVKTFLWRAEPTLWVSTGPVDLEAPVVRGGSWLAPVLGGGSFGRMGRVHLTQDAFDTLVRELEGELARHRATT